MYLSDLDGSLILLTLLFIQWEPFSERQVQNYRRELVGREGNIGPVPPGRHRSGFWCLFCMWIRVQWKCVYCGNACNLGLLAERLKRSCNHVSRSLLIVNSSLSHYSILCQKIKSFPFEAKNPHFIFFIVYGCPVNRHLVAAYSSLSRPCSTFHRYPSLDRPSLL